MKKRVTMNVSPQNYGELCAVQKKIEKILHKPISLDKVLSIVLAVKSVDDVLSDLVLERET